MNVLPAVLATYLIRSKFYGAWRRQELDNRLSCSVICNQFGETGMLITLIRFI